MQNLKCVIKPVIIVATRIATKGVRKDVKDLPGKYSIDSLQKDSCGWNITHNMESTAV